MRRGQENSREAARNFLVVVPERRREAAQERDEDLLKWRLAAPKLFAARAEQRLGALGSYR